MNIGLVSDFAGNLRSSAVAPAPTHTTVFEAYLHPTSSPTLTAIGHHAPLYCQARHPTFRPHALDRGLRLRFRSGYWVGHSFGGQQGFVAAAQAPRFWKGLLLLAPQTDRVNPTTAASMTAMAQAFARDPDTAAYADELADTPGGAAMWARNGIYGAFAREMALRQRSPGLVLAFGALVAPREGDFAWRGMGTKIVMVFGGGDEIAPVGEGRYALGQLEGVEGAQARLVVLEEAGHWIIWECEELVVDEIMKLVDG